jgi:hypothetical protein
MTADPGAEVFPFLRLVADRSGKKAALPLQSSGLTQVGPFTSGFELWARFEVGGTTGALALIRNETSLPQSSMTGSSPFWRPPSAFADDLLAKMKE